MCEQCGCGDIEPVATDDDNTVRVRPRGAAKAAPAPR